MQAIRNHWFKVVYWLLNERTLVCLEMAFILLLGGILIKLRWDAASLFIIPLCVMMLPVSGRELQDQLALRHPGPIPIVPRWWIKLGDVLFYLSPVLMLVVMPCYEWMF